MHALVDMTQCVLSLTGHLTIDRPIWSSIAPARPTFRTCCSTNHGSSSKVLLWATIGWFAGIGRGPHARRWLATGVCSPSPHGSHRPVLRHRRHRHIHRRLNPAHLDRRCDDDVGRASRAPSYSTHATTRRESGSQQAGDRAARVVVLGARHVDTVGGVLPLVGDVTRDRASVAISLLECPEPLPLVAEPGAHVAILDVGPDVAAPGCRRRPPAITLRWTTLRVRSRRGGLGSRLPTGRGGGGRGSGPPARACGVAVGPFVAYRM